MIALRPFTDTDWLCFAGAECFADGSAPLIGEIEVGSIEGNVVLDANGLAVMWVTCAVEGGDHQDHYAFWPTERAAQALALLPARTSLQVLLALGAQKL